MADTNGTAAPSVSLLQTFSALMSRMRMGTQNGVTFNGRRDLYEVLGYQSHLAYQDFKARFLRQDLAQRLVKIYPDATWNHPPAVTEEEQDPPETPFVVGWGALAQRLRLYAMFHRADILANLGRFAVLLIGLRGQPELAQPARPVASPDDVLFVEPYSEEWTEIHQLDRHADSPNFGKPDLYRIDFRRGHRESQQAALGLGKVTVHASRVIHIPADDLLDDEIYGLPKLEAIFNRLDDLQKVVGGAAEQYWRDAKRRIALEVRDGYTIGADQQAAITEESEEFQHDLRDILRVQGIDVKNLSGTVADPLAHFTMLTDICCAVFNVPKRKLLGSERGELASSQDERSWRESVSTRQTMIAEPRYVRALADRFLLLRALPPPVKRYQVVFENLLGLSEEQQATIAERVANALQRYAGPGMGQMIVPPMEFRTEYLGLAPVPEGGFLDLEPGNDDEGEDETDEGEDEIEQDAEDADEEDT